MGVRFGPQQCGLFFRYDILIDDEVSMPSKNASPQCNHPCIRKAYYLGLPGEGYVCVACYEYREQEEWEDFVSRSEPGGSGAMCH